jgi:RNA polymerase sigma factor (sigma-70 family)
LDNDELICACLRREKNAWDLFVERFSRLVYWSIQQTLKDGPWSANQDLVHDIFQDIFTQLIEKEELKRLKESKNIKRFLCVMASHKTLNAIRSLTRRGHTALEDSLEKSAGLESVEADVLRAEKDELIHCLLETLSESERQCLELYYLEEKTHEEIGAQLGIPKGTVSTLIRRSREWLKEKFRQKGLLD